MATYYFRNTGNTAWNNGNNWSLTDGGAAAGAYPSLVTDDAYFTSLSGNCTLTAGATCQNLVFSGVGAGNYSGTFSLATFNLNVKVGLTLSATMTIPTTTGVLTLIGSCAMRSNGKQWNNPINFASTFANAIYNLLDNWTINGNVTFSAASGKFNNNTLTLTGNLNMQANSNIGTSTIVFSGSTTSSWTAGANAWGLYNNVNINKVGGTLNIGSVAYYVGTMTYIAGTVTHTGTLITSGSTTATFNVNGSSSSSATTTSSTGINWNNVTFSGASSAAIITLSSNFTVCGTLSIGNHGIVGSNVYLLGNLTLTATQATTTTPTTPIIIHGTADQTWSGNFNLRQPLTINKPSGTLTISGSVGYNTGTFTYTAGNVNTAGSTLTSSLPTTFNTAGISFNNVSLTGAGTYTLNSLLQVSGSLVMGAADQTLTGTAGFTTYGLNISPSAARTITLETGKTYTVTNSLTLVGSSALAKLNIVSSSGTTRALFTLGLAASQSVTNTDATRIDSSYGQTIACGASAVLVDTLNWYVPYSASTGNFFLMFG